MIKLLNKILNRFGFELVNKKPDMTLVEASVKFLDMCPKSSLVDHSASFSTYVGDINYIKERVKGEFPQVSGKTYYEENHYGLNKKYFNFDGVRYAPEELEEKLKNE